MAFPSETIYSGFSHKSKDNGCVKSPRHFFALRCILRQGRMRRHRQYQASSAFAISLLIDTREEDRGEKRHQTRALTVNGVFEEVKDQIKRDMIKARLLARHPHLIVLTDNPDAEFFTVRIKSLQLLEGVAEASFETIE